MRGVAMLHIQLEGRRKNPSLRYMHSNPTHNSVRRHYAFSLVILKISYVFKLRVQQTLLYNFSMSSCLTSVSDESIYHLFIYDFVRIQLQK